mmetsp:Transcript_27000/g.47662  ORF Transcript_27000/g.47662 Transcript_27000/m.47662 type:complete len:355 (-) Transcript_27000:609-1673(-)
MGAVLFELLRQQISIHGWMKRHKGRTKARGKCSNWLLDTAFCTSDLGGITGHEVIHGLASTQLGNWRKHTEGVTRKENDIVGMSRHLLLEVSINVENRVRDTSVLCDGGVKVIGSSVRIQFDILQKRVGMNGAINIRLRLFGQVDSLRVATSFEVVNTIFVPSMLVVSDEGTVRVGRKSCFTGSRQTEEEADIAILSNIGRTMHRKLRRIRQWERVVHQGEDSLFVFTTVPSSKDDSFALFNIENNSSLGMQVVSFPIFVGLGAGIDDGEVGLKIVQLGGVGRSDEHIGDEMLLPGIFVNKTDLLARLGGGTNIAVKDVGSVERVEEFDGLLVEFFKNFWSRCLVDIIPVKVFG